MAVTDLEAFGAGIWNLKFSIFSARFCQLFCRFFTNFYREVNVFQNRITHSKKCNSNGASHLEEGKVGEKM